MDIEREIDVFHRALELPDEERVAFVRSEYGADEESIERVLRLLRHHERSDPTRDLSAKLEPTPLAVPERIGPYTILERLGEGGMGVVYLARQSEPVQRRVAIKLVKSGADSEEIVARFDTERQALALMSHPSIARILDAGVFDGRPFFVMEHIVGAPITEHCDRTRAPIEDRLRLLNAVCEGVQHAHQKGIVHRDLKPSNVLVSDEHGAPIPKIIDFGIAKAISDEAFEPGLRTEVGRIVGTPDYMSPEQWETSKADVDTRADVYSLGALLYELLCGDTPFGFHETPFDYAEMRHRILERVPAPPSARLAEDSARAVEIAERRGTSPSELAKRLREDLDWIVQKALEKDRARRYASASELAADVSRFLAREPVVARPPSRMYRVARFVDRNRLATGAAAAIALVLITTTAVTLWFAMSERRQRTLAERAVGALGRERREAVEGRDRAQAMVNFLTDDVLRAARPADSPGAGRDVLVRDALDVAAERLDERVRPGGVLADRPDVVAQLRGALGITYAELGAYEQAERQLSRGYELALVHLGPRDATTLDIVLLLAMSYRGLSRIEDAERTYLEAIDLFDDAFGDAPEALVALENYGVFLDTTGRSEDALAIYEDVFDRLFVHRGERHRETIAAASNLAPTLARHGQAARALEISERYLEIARGTLGVDDPATLGMLQARILVLQPHGVVDQVVPVAQELVDASRRVLGPNHDQTAYALVTLGSALRDSGDVGGALSAFEEALRTYELSLGDDHRETWGARANVADALNRIGSFAEAAEILAPALDHLSDDFPAGDPNVGIVQGLFAESLLGLEQFEEAATEGREAYETIAAASGVLPEFLDQAARRMVRIYDAWFRYDGSDERAEEAERWRAIADD
ncbi:MAG: tetratricopeptide repeat protein [Planctomycetota bacterium]